jgi:hypothetical protein
MEASKPEGQGVVEDSGTEGPVIKPEKSRSSKLVSWVARLTSLPILGLILSSLVPALVSFSVSAHDDKIIALGLSVTFAGILFGWRFARVGGVIILAGVALMLSQEDNLLYPDPFSLAFGLQGIIFLIAGSFVAARSAAGPKFAWGNRIAIAALVVIAAAGAFAILRGPGPTPVPKEKAGFVGVWVASRGLTLEFNPEGFAKIGLEKDSDLAGFKLPVAPGQTNTFMAYFHDDGSLELNGGLLSHSQTYRIDRRPHPEGSEIKFSLRDDSAGSKGNRIVLVKRPTS